MINLRSYCFWVALFLSLKLHAQDPAFSQFYANRLYLNPAFTGIDRGIAFFASSRIQWIKADNGFRTMAATLELQQPFIKSGFGLSVFADRQGLAALTTTSVSLSYAYILPFRKSNLHFGLQTSFVQKSIDWSQLVFSDQLDPVLGVIYPTAAVAGLERVAFSDVQAGILFRTEGRLKWGKQLYRNVRSSVGISIHHLPSFFGSEAAVESFQQLPTEVPVQITLHASTIIPVIIFEGVGHAVALAPNFKIEVWRTGAALRWKPASVQPWVPMCYIGDFIGAFSIRTSCLYPPGYIQMHGLALLGGISR